MTTTGTAPTDPITTPDLTTMTLPTIMTGTTLHTPTALTTSELRKPPAASEKAKFCRSPTQFFAKPNLAVS